LKSFKLFINILSKPIIPHSRTNLLSTCYSPIKLQTNKQHRLQCKQFYFMLCLNRLVVSLQTKSLCSEKYREWNVIKDSPIIHPCDCRETNSFISNAHLINRYSNLILLSFMDFYRHNYHIFHFTLHSPRWLLYSFSPITFYHTLWLQNSSICKHSQSITQIYLSNCFLRPRQAMPIA
jgi:hypothetical protein